MRCSHSAHERHRRIAVELTRGGKAERRSAQVIQQIQALQGIQVAVSVKGFAVAPIGEQVAQQLVLEEHRVVDRRVPR